MGFPHFFSILGALLREHNTSIWDAWWHAVHLGGRVQDIQHYRSFGKDVYYLCKLFYLALCVCVCMCMCVRVITPFIIHTRLMRRHVCFRDTIKHAHRQLLRTYACTYCTRTLTHTQIMRPAMREVKLFQFEWVPSATVICVPTMWFLVAVHLHHVFIQLNFLCFFFVFFFFFEMKS